VFIRELEDEIATLSAELRALLLGEEPTDVE
jgi:hypothetical protein